ncbi:MAG: hypothetical protein ABIN68_02485 [Sphingomicrobium sp.]
MKMPLIAFVLSVTVTAPAMAALPVGAKAPDFVTVGAIAGKPFRLHLAKELRKGPGGPLLLPKGFHQGLHA